MDINSKLIKALHSRTDEYLSGTEIAVELGVSRTAVWKHIEQIRSVGYEIEAVPHLGYRLVKIPDKLLPDEIERGLKTSVIGKKILVYEKCSSTSDVAEEIARSGGKEGTVIFAEHQTNGRGRLGRKWISYKGKDILCSVILRPYMTPQNSSLITIIAAASVCEVLREFGILAGIKWPNDIVVKGRKIGGILTEINTEMDRINYVILGIGLNVNSSLKNLSSKVVKTATSMIHETENKVDRIETVRKLLKFMDHKYEELKRGKYSEIMRECIDFSETLGRVVKIRSGKKVYAGYAQDFDDSGALNLRKDDGAVEKVVSGELI
ncbi:MAG: biotin--[acetyl-CoA-carboxylase] ligase [Candidatus Aureabacteria bacterium]|nr:biotin--[acetyl-CoA-carboxylase] ligase [Candidatus Auribacterota bacterium]MCK5160318.1 biotin--[acetyl-CoA-carboxylase] ligase [Candidatus Auribacterota bacterium]